MNGLNNSEHDDHEQPSERTALLANINAPPHLDAFEYPPIEPVILQITAKGISSCGSSDWCPNPLSSLAVQTAFSLVVLLELRKIVSSGASRSQQIWEQWSQEQEDAETLQYLDHHVLSVWSEFLSEERSAEEIESALWQPFPVRHESLRLLRVVDFLCYRGAPRELLEHRIVYFSFIQTWKYGRRIQGRNPALSVRLIRIYDALCTPRVLHAVALVLHLSYLALLTHFVLFPPVRSVSTVRSPTPDLREALLMIYSGARLLQTWSLGTCPFLLVLLVFLYCLPSVPFPDGLAYSVLLFAFSWNVIELHIPRAPSPIFLFPFPRILPLAVLIWQGISRIFFPVVMFFLPALLLSLFLLSTSLSDIFSHLLTVDSLDPAPMETRVAFISLFAVIFSLLLCSIIMLVLVYPSLPLDTQAHSPWDQYSKPVGLEARRALVRIVVAYCAPYAFPAPFNLVELLTVRLPVSLATVLGWKEVAMRFEVVERVFWRMTIGPIAAMVAGGWVWGLRDPRRGYGHYH
ncbi:hypothetical protein SCP_0111480 [Sparassis crispa]|uniref:Uncharacterized protein n=1 Tax=Sparassis crispa TaxID=139825 RepID=A0A401G7W7_9APHY|nr:hypothetical protein SCP_0111480 [Sparassis crispa]GBE78265.1 hypothetical protein SCP_0111480 [Sparassis crispa]